MTSSDAFSDTISAGAAAMPEPLKAPLWQMPPQHGDDALLAVWPAKALALVPYLAESTKTAGEVIAAASKIHSLLKTPLPRELEGAREKLMDAAIAVAQALVGRERVNLDEALSAARAGLEWMLSELASGAPSAAPGDC